MARSTLHPADTLPPCGYTPQIRGGQARGALRKPKAAYPADSTVPALERFTHVVSHWEEGAPAYGLHKPNAGKVARLSCHQDRPPETGSPSALFNGATNTSAALSGGVPVKALDAELSAPPTSGSQLAFQGCTWDPSASPPGRPSAHTPRSVEVADVEYEEGKCL